MEIDMNLPCSPVRKHAMPNPGAVWPLALGLHSPLPDCFKECRAETKSMVFCRSKSFCFERQGCAWPAGAKRQPVPKGDQARAPCPFRPARQFSYGRAQGRFILKRFLRSVPAHRRCSPL